MSDYTTIEIRSAEFNSEILIEKQLSVDKMQQLERQLNAIVNDHICHDMRGRIASVNMSMYMVEKMISPEATPRFQLLKNQIEDLSRLIDKLTQ